MADTPTHNHLWLLIRNRLTTLGIDNVELIRRMGYSNIAKGLRRLEAIQTGNCDKLEVYAPALSIGLGLPITTIQQAIIATRTAQRAQADEAYRIAFVPHAVLVTTRSIPSQIVIAALIRADRWLRIELTSGSSPVTYVRQVLATMPATVPTFGAVTGFVINYRYDCAVEFDLRGDPVKMMDRAARIGMATASVNGRPLAINLVHE